MSIEFVIRFMLLIFFCFNSIIIFCIYFYKSDFGEMVFKVAFKICEMVLYFINIDVVFGRLY